MSLRIWHTLDPLVLTITSQSRYYQYPHFTDEETEVLCRSLMNLPSGHTVRARPQVQVQCACHSLCSWLLPALFPPVKCEDCSNPPHPLPPHCNQAPHRAMPPAGSAQPQDFSWLEETLDTSYWNLLILWVGRPRSTKQCMGKDNCPSETPTDAWYIVVERISHLSVSSTTKKILKGKANNGKGRVPCLLLLHITHDARRSQSS